MKKYKNKNCLIRSVIEMKTYKLANLETAEIISFKARNKYEADFRCQMEIELRDWNITACVCREISDKE